MKRKGSRTDDQISDECDKEDTVMAILPAVVHAFEGKIDKYRIREGVDNLSGVF